MSAPCRAGELEARASGDLLEVVRRSPSGARTLFVNFGSGDRALDTNQGPRALFHSGAFDGRTLGASSAVILDSSIPN